MIEIKNNINRKISLIEKYQISLLHGLLNLEIIVHDIHFYFFYVTKMFISHYPLVQERLSW